MIVNFTRNAYRHRTATVIVNFTLNAYRHRTAIVNVYVMLVMRTVIGRKRLALTGN